MIKITTVTRHIETDSWMKFGHNGRTPIAAEIMKAEAEQIISDCKGTITESKNADFESWHIDLWIIPQSMIRLKF